MAVLILFTAFCSQTSYARPEYALQEKLNCAACHVTAWGGGPRTTYGKVYGSHENKISKMSESDLYYGDLRMIAYRPTHPSKTQSGFALMTAAPTANLPVYQGAANSEMRLVYTLNSSPLGGTYAREAYLSWQAQTAGADVPARLTLGRFYLPFGILTDEHRAYTRMQSRMPLENYEMGAALSANLSTDLHFDLALVNDLESGGTFSNRNVTWGGVLNFRANPSTLPFFIGLSGSYGHVLNTPEPYAISSHAGISLDRITGSKLSGSLLLERVDAWNQPQDRSGSIHPSLNTFFQLNSSPRGQHSVGYFSQAKFNMSNRWVLLYRFDYLKPDSQLPENTFARHGIGFEIFLPGNLIIDLRAEKAVVASKPAGPDGEEPLGAQNALLAMIRCWI
ncbi:MAG: hypothetical protein A2070_07465 [Bdellovibrionales bacterium GWC1_52_8]|nr:MAG: hypothetical protein A2Z97_06865 [Bdellovibrionales bacterium GWB1_52_6]OFZ05472.1 MAG: hypothetical protein A2X97_11385 [Bdellovibrionales bacterium GWA1_52_35]OFZ40456.1 MAG: hypothetical protein A2070_07465 [Bdellovibrionales bacterium GWC1_52_8]HCM39164.1 hypothetical protein [Bdellovibrionales bacterium]